MKGILGLALLCGCYSGVDARTGPGGASAGADEGGEAGESDDAGDPARDDDGETVPRSIAISGARRLTTVEYVDTLRHLLDVDASAAHTVLPTPDFMPFDNDYTTQTESAALVVGVESLAREIAAMVVEDPARLQDLVGCDASESACFDAFLRDFGRRALRRPITDDEVSAWSEAFLAEGDGSIAVGLALQTLLQHPEFLYRIDRGEVVRDDIVRLDDFAVASRLSYLLWGSGPDDELLDLAEADALSRPTDVREAAARMLEDDRALQRIARFHGMWMGYEFMATGGDLGASMRQETTALLDRVIFEQRDPWHDLFRAEETFVDELLATHYGLPAPADPSGDWVSYGDTGRGGLFSHGTFLSNGTKNGDTSPTLRGLLIRTKLMCQDVPPPPPDVNDAVPDADAVPDSPCKIDRYAAHRTQPSCAGCHALMDGLGFGLENYDQLGRYREHDIDHPECVIEGEGDVPGVGTFRGPAELGALLVDSGTLEGCLVQQTYRFAVGRTEIDDVDQELIDRVLQRVDIEALRFDELLLEYVSEPAFGYARRGKVQD